MPIPQASSQWRKAPFVPGSPWGRIFFFQWYFQFTECLQFWCMRSCVDEKRPDLGENQTSTSQTGIMLYGVHPLPNRTLVRENRFSRSEPKRCLRLERTQLLPMLHLPWNWFLILEDCQFIIFCWCNPWLCKAETKTSSNHSQASKYLLLFPRMSYPLLALYVATEEHSVFISLMNALSLYFFPGLFVSFPSFFWRKQAW